MQYLNTKTQAVIETACVISGGDWVKVNEQPEKDTKPTEKKTTRKRVVRDNE